MPCSGSPGGIEVCSDAGAAVSGPQESWCGSEGPEGDQKGGRQTVKFLLLLHKIIVKEKVWRKSPCHQEQELLGVAFRARRGALGKPRGHVFWEQI